MKQFLLNVLASIVGLIVTMAIAGFGVLLFVMCALAVGVSETKVDVKDNSVLHLTLEGNIVERQQERSLLEEIQGYNTPQQSIEQIVAAINAACDDSRIKGIYIDCKGVNAGTSTLSYIRQELCRFKESGKWIVAYGDSYTQSDYYVASAADSVWVNPVGSVDIHGLGGSMMFYKGLLDKLGIEMQVVKVGTYKSAVEPYILTEPSEANCEQIKAYITPIWEFMCRQIADSRQVKPEDVNAWADSIIMTQSVPTLVAKKVVTAAKYRHQAEDAIEALADDYSLISTTDYPINNTHSKKESNIAVLYAEGYIVDSGNEGIVGDEMTPLILDLADDDDVDALVLRVNSGGGSAFASEQMWEALEQFKATGKPFYVSMGDVAASGGYYISCGANKIYCQPTTITGSIGIFGLIPSVKGLLSDKLGVNVSTIATNPQANIGMVDPMTARQRLAMQSLINRGYETFVKRCAEGRGLSVDSIKAIAEGRVWDGRAALRIGLVDTLGTLNECIADLALNAGMDKYHVTPYPDPRRKWWEQMLKDASNVKEQIVKQQIGDAYPLYKAMERVKTISPVQARMTDIVIR